MLNQISEAEFWVKKKRAVLLLCQAKGVNDLKTMCPNLGKRVESFIAFVQRV